MEHFIILLEREDIEIKSKFYRWMVSHYKIDTYLPKINFSSLTLVKLIRKVKSKLHGKNYQKKKDTNIRIRRGKLHYAVLCTFKNCL